MGGHQRMGGDRSAAPREQASRRRMVAALVGGGFTGALGRDESAAKKRRKKRRRTSCELGCTVSTCNRLPAGCSLFPTDTIWNTAIDALPRDARSDAYVASIGADRGLHADFEAGFYRGQPIGIPFVVVPSARPLAPITFAAYGDESDPGPYPAPPDAPIEGGPCSDGDRHVLVVQDGACMLYELYAARPRPDGGWDAQSGVDLGRCGGAADRHRVAAL